MPQIIRARCSGIRYCPDPLGIGGNAADISCPVQWYSLLPKPARYRYVLPSPVLPPKARWGDRAGSARIHFVHSAVQIVSSLTRSVSAAMPQIIRARCISIRHCLNPLGNGTSPVLVILSERGVPRSESKSIELLPAKISPYRHAMI